MAHVKVTEREDGILQILVDGEDFNPHIFADGVKLVRVGDGDFAEWGLTVTLAVDDWGLDLPDGVDAAIRTGEALILRSEA